MCMPTVCSPKKPKVKKVIEEDSGLPGRGEWKPESVTTKKRNPAKEEQGRREMPITVDSGRGEYWRLKGFGKQSREKERFSRGWGGSTCKEAEGRIKNVDTELKRVRSRKARKKTKLLGGKRREIKEMIIDYRASKWEGMKIGLSRGKCLPRILGG